MLHLLRPHFNRSRRLHLWVTAVVLVVASSPILLSHSAETKPPSDPRDHWAYKPLIKPPEPALTDAGWVRNPIDRFVLAKLREKNLAPAPPADARTLIRRVYFDLTGLPPTPEEVAAFVADASPDAYEKLIDRLLQSPRYGERWARHWLDVVHYGESHGYGMDRPRPNAWPYRDYVIASFNADKPYARFVQEQIAGDVLFPDDPQGIAALGFIAAGPWNQSPQAEQNDNIVCKKIAQNLDRDDMVMTTLSTFASTTVHCARCHDHKFDPIAQAEYYALQACFAGVDRADRPFDPDPKKHALRRTLLAQKRSLETGKPPPAGIELPPAPTEAELAAWSKLDDPSVWTVLEASDIKSAAGSTAARQADGSLLFGGPRGLVDTYTITARTAVRGVTAIRLDVLPDDALPLKGPGRQENGNFALNEFSVTAGPAPVQFAAVSADFQEDNWPIAAAVDGNVKTAWGIYPQIAKPHIAIFQTKGPIAAEADGQTTLVIRLDQQNGAGHVLGRLKLSVTSIASPPRADSVPYAARLILAVPESQRTDAQKAEFLSIYRRNIVDRQLAELGTPQVVYAATNDFPAYHKFQPAGTPRPIFVLNRGDVTQPKEAANPGALSCIEKLDAKLQIGDPNDEGSRRAALAKWLTDPNNVLVWRSIANRVWHYHMGRGIVETPNDFGHMGGRPSHPELLDWLAATFRDGGGSMKQLHKLILTSATYRQSTVDNPAAAQVDGSNVYLWHMGRTRLDAECVRDAILQITGTIDLTMGGPPVKQFVFEDPNIDVTPKAHYDKFDVDSAASRRRSIYRYLFRTLPDPFMDSLDCPDPSQLTARRNQSVTALQALSMFNDRFVVQYAAHLAERVKNAGDTTAQIKLAYELALARPPVADEEQTLLAYATKHGMANTCRVILNSNEFLFVD